MAAWEKDYDWDHHTPDYEVGSCVPITTISDDAYVTAGNWGMHPAAPTLTPVDQAAIIAAEARVLVLAAGKRKDVALQEYADAAREMNVAARALDKAVADAARQ